MSVKVGVDMHGLVDQALVAAQHFVQALVGDGILDDNVVYRQQVPADRWYHDYKGDFTTTKQELEARGWAIFYTLEGSARTVVEAVRIFFAKYVASTQEGIDRNEIILQAQIQSLKYTAWAIIDPVGQKKTTVEEFAKGHFPVGCSKDAFHWGDKYQGTMTIPLSLDYNWHPTN
jgi:hypothetical protein